MFHNSLILHIPTWLSPHGSERLLWPSGTITNSHSPSTNWTLISWRANPPPIPLRYTSGQCDSAWTSGSFSHTYHSSFRWRRHHLNKHSPLRSVKPAARMLLFSEAGSTSGGSTAGTKLCNHVTSSVNNLSHQVTQGSYCSFHAHKWQLYILRTWIWLFLIF